MSVLGWVCSVHHASELEFHRGGAGNHSWLLSTRATQKVGVLFRKHCGGGVSGLGVRQAGATGGSSRLLQEE